MSFVDDLIEIIVDRHAVTLKGTFTLSLVAGGIRIKGEALSSLRDQKKSKVTLDTAVPIDAEIRVGEIVIPLPSIK